MFRSAQRSRVHRVDGWKNYLVLGFLVCLALTGCREGMNSGNPEAGGESASGVDAKSATGKQLLKQMLTAYQQATSYADSGELTVRMEQDGEEQNSGKLPFSVTYEKPNKLRINAFGVMLVCDGKQLRASVQDLEGQILALDAPPEITLDTIYSDTNLSKALGGGIDVVLPQLKLLLDDQALDSELNGSEKITRLDDQKLGDDLCHVVDVTSKEGHRVYWIDSASHILRRLEYPTAELRKRIDPNGQLSSLTVRADLKGAQLNQKIAEHAFEFEVPPGARLLKHFLSPPPQPPAPMLGQKAEGFQFVRLDGEKVTPESLQGKIVVLDFWATWCGWCFKGFPNLDKVYNQFKDDDQVVILTVNTDNPEVTDKQVQDSFDRYQFKLPIVRDPQEDNTKVFRVTGLPTMYILGPDGTVQDVETGYKEDLAEVLPAKLKRLKAGEDLAKQALEEYQKEINAYDKQVNEATVGASAQIEIPVTEIAPFAQPGKFQLEKRWTSSEFKGPGNILVMAPADGAPTFFVLDGSRAVVELDAAGKQVNRHDLDLPSQTGVSYLRTAIADGRRYFAAFAAGEQQFHLFDDKWAKLLSYPDVKDGRHAGIADVQFGDLDGDGHVEINVGYFGVVGIQQVSLEGKRNWSNRLIENLYHLAVTEPDANQHRLLLCANGRDRVFAGDYYGKALEGLPAPNRAIHWIVAADLLSDSTSQLCALSTTKVGQTIAVGLDPRQGEMWHYDLPKGVIQMPIEPLVPGRVKAGEPGVWLLPAADGSVHMLTAEGNLLDKFNSGETLTGLASAVVDGAPVLIISSTTGVTAWDIK